MPSSTQFSTRFSPLTLALAAALLTLASTDARAQAQGPSDWPGLQIDRFEDRMVGAAVVGAGTGPGQAFVIWEVSGRYSPQLPIRLNETGTRQEAFRARVRMTVPASLYSSGQTFETLASSEGVFSLRVLIPHGEGFPPLEIIDPAMGVTYTVGGPLADAPGTESLHGSEGLLGQGVPGGFGD